MPIPIKPDLHTRERYIGNISSVFERASVDQMARGANWYRTAHQLAEMIADGNVAAGAGVIAALSANKQWDVNVRLATRAFENGEPTGHFQDAIRKASRIMQGERPENVLPMDAKTGQFYLCILDPGDPVAVTIDRHAHDIAVGERYGDRDRGLSSKGRYALLADIYRDAARRIGIIPQVLQAVTWVVWIETRES